MSTFSPTTLLGRKIAGYTIDTVLDSDADSTWFEARADNGDRAIFYVYSTPEQRDAARPRIHGFRTAADAVLAGPPEVHLFVNVGDHRLMMPRDLRELLTGNDTRPKDFGGYAIERVLGHGYKGVTYEARRAGGPGTVYALKLTIAEEYEGRTYLPEVDRMVELARRDRDHFPQIHACGNYTFAHGASQYPLVYFVEDFISGQTVEKLLTHSPASLDAFFLYEFVREMLAAIATLQACSLMHDDLHGGNVMLHEPLTGRRRPYLIDFGSAKPHAATKKKRDDIRNLASQIAAIANAVQQHRPARTAYEERILTACEALLAAISDDDPMRRPEDARGILEHFERSFGQGAVRQQLIHPFDFGNAEEVMDNSLLYSLAAKTFPWRDQIESSSHLLVIGPRGCGKTTVFRSMSFKCLADADQIEAGLARPYLGLYISCNKEFRQRFSAIDRAILLARQDDVRHYFNLIVLRELATALTACAERSHLLDPDLSALNSFLRGHLPSLVITPLANSADLEARVTRALHEARMAIWNGVPIAESTNQGFVADLATFVASQIGPFRGKTLYLFVDDYTEGKVPKEAQRALNHILFVPNSVYKCKISSEVFGVPLDETFGNFLSQERDYREWNLGTLYCLHLPSKEQKAFLGEIVNTRLALCQYAGRVETVIGDSHYSEGTLARTLKREAERRKARKQALGQKPALLVDKEVDRQVREEGVVAHYHGWDTICELCTGDVSNILELLNRMYDQCGVKRDSVSLIQPDHQDAVIEDYARQYIGKIKGIPRYGERMFSIVNAFGTMARQLLDDYPWVPHGDGREEPYQVLRIELDEAFRGSVEEIDRFNAGTPDGYTGQALELWKLLQRYCIFIDAEKSRSRRNTLSSRVILRRIFCPAFRIGLVNSECWTLSRQQWEAFCDDPSSRADQYVRTSVEAALRRRGELPTQQAQGTLFPDKEGGA
jgi:hypothetical protein